MRPWLSKGRRGREILPLQRDDNARFMPWIMAVMIFLLTLALTFAFAMRSAMQGWNMALTATLTVEIPAPAPSDAKTDTADLRVEKIIALLKTTEGIAKIDPVDPKEAINLLETWLGEGNVRKDLPVPRLVDVTIADDAELDLTELEEKMQSLVPGATLDDHKMWMDDLLGFMHRLMLAIYGVCGLIAAASLVMIMFATRSGLVTHHRTIELLHIMGARNFYIARQFSRSAFWLGLLGGIVGLCLAAGLTYLLARSFANVTAGLLPDWQLTPLAIVCIASLPVLSGFFAAMTAKLTVLSKLSRVV